LRLVVGHGKRRSESTQEVFSMTGKIIGKVPEDHLQKDLEKYA